MPQLLPFYFVSQLSYAFLALLFLTYVYSVYFIPTFTQLNVVRMYFTIMLLFKLLFFLHK